MTCDLWNNVKTLSGLIGQLVSVTGCSGQQIYKGVLISADPVSKSVVIVSKSADEEFDQNDVLKSEINKTESYNLQLIPWVDLKTITVQDKTSNSNDEDLDTSNFRISFLKSLFTDNTNNKYFDENIADLTNRKTAVKGYLEKHQLSVKEDTNRNLIVHDLVTIVSPYMSVNCEGTNQIVLDRIRNLITQLHSNTK